jgi:hypothetical protein
MVHFDDTTWCHYLTFQEKVSAWLGSLILEEIWRVY